MPITIDNSNRKIIFCILAHDDPIMLNLLLEKLDDFDCFVHLDKKSFHSMYSSLSYRNQKVKVIPFEQSIKVHWGGFSVVRSMILLAESAIKFKHNEKLLLVFLSGHCYPLKPVNEIESEFRNSCGDYIAYSTHSRATSEFQFRFSRYWNFDIFPSMPDSKLMRIINGGFRRMLSTILTNRITKETILPASGSQWIALRSEVFQELIKNSNEKKFRFLKHVFAPDEIFFHTLYANSKYSNQNQNYGEKKINQKGTYQLANFHLIHPTLTKIYSIEDFNEIIKSKNLFLRKVNSDKSIELIHALNTKS